MTDTLKDYFKHNNTPETDPLIIWEAHKCTIRGELIRMGSQRKKQREKEIKTLTDHIHNLESLHKQSLSVKSATELLATRKELQQILDNRTKQFLFFKKKLYYESGNKTAEL